MNTSSPLRHPPCHCGRCDDRSVTPLYRPRLPATCRRWAAYEVVRPTDLILAYGPVSATEVAILDGLERAR